MKIKHKMSIDLFVKGVIEFDKDASKITESWNLEKDDIISVLVEHFEFLGIYEVLPMEHAELIYDNVLFQLKNSPVLGEKIEKVNEAIRRHKEKHSRRHG